MARSAHLLVNLEAAAHSLSVVSGHGAVVVPTEVDGRHVIVADTQERIKARLRRN